MPREKAQVAQTARPKVPMHRLGADCFVVALKRGNARGAKGAGHRHLARVNRQREEPDIQWKAAAFVRWHEPDDANGFGAFSRIVASPGSEIWLSSRRQLIPCCTDKTCSLLSGLRYLTLLVPSWCPQVPDRLETDCPSCWSRKTLSL